MLQTIFGNELHLNNGESTIRMEKTRMTFRNSVDALTRVNLTTITSLRENLGSKFQVDNVEVITGGG